MNHATNERPLTEFEKHYREEIEKRNREVASCLIGIRTACRLIHAFPDWEASSILPTLIRECDHAMHILAEPQPEFDDDDFPF